MSGVQLRYIARTKGETTLYSGGPTLQQLCQIFPDERNKVEFSKNGSLICGVGQEDVTVLDMEQISQVAQLPLRECLHVGFSSRNTYLTTLQRPDKQLKGSDKNLQIWDIASGICVWGMHRSNVNDDVWPLLHWLEDESSVFVSVANTVHVYTPSDNFAKVAKKLHVKNIASFSVSPGKNPKLSAYIPEAKSVPATVLIYPISGFPKSMDDAPVVNNRKSFYRVSGIEFLWNSKGSALLCSSFSDVDVTNQSYYGEQHLHFFQGDSDVSCVVPSIPQGPIHDVQWAPPGDHFVVVAGFMPAKTLLFDAKCKPLFDLGSGAHNFVRFNPFGRFLCVAGFGNLPGDIVFYEKKGNGTCKKLSSVRCPSVSLEWSPCGRFILTAITAPRLRVDNGVKVFTYLGEEVGQESAEVLLEARWVPVEQGTFEDRPVSPSKRSTISQKAKQEETTTAAYVPPHLRGSNRTAAPVSFNLGRSNDSGGRIHSQPKGPDVPGGTFLSKAAAKNAKRRAKRKTEIQKQTTESAEQQTPEVTAVASEPSIAQTVSSGTSPLSATPEEKTKRIRTLKKKLKQISHLKESMQQPGVTLEKEQLQKVQSEAAILAELEALGTC